MTPCPVVLPEKPANSLSFLEDGTAVGLFYPYRCDLTDEQFRLIEAAPRKRLLFCVASDSPMPQVLQHPPSLDDLPVQTIRWAFARATYVEVVLLDARKPESTQEEFVTLVLDRIDKKMAREHPFLIVFLTDDPRENGDSLIRIPPNKPRRRLASRKEIALGT
jgi:hypothetical protein